MGLITLTILLAVRFPTAQAFKVLLLLVVATNIGGRYFDDPPSPFEALLRGVIDTLTPVERVVRDDAGCWYALRVRPYRMIFANRMSTCVRRSPL